MKSAIWVSLVAFCITFYACQDKEQTESSFTGNQVSYSLLPGDEWDFYGEVIFKELRDSTTQIEIQLKNTKGTKMFPTHLHYNSYDIEADLAASLNPVNASTGKSITQLKHIGDQEPIFYNDLVNFDGHVKIHFDDGINKNVILSYGNIGQNCDKPLDKKIADCESE